MLWTLAAVQGAAFLSVPANLRDPREHPDRTLLSSLLCPSSAPHPKWSWNSKDCVTDMWPPELGSLRRSLERLELGFRKTEMQVQNSQLWFLWCCFNFRFLWRGARGWARIWPPQPPLAGTLSQEAQKPRRGFWLEPRSHLNPDKSSWPWALHDTGVCASPRQEAVCGFAS